ncbi:MAG TPA: thioredoxin domain-containing protein [Vicinamibacterales bacterium]|nr:thioredoxin domain-containing protein [Vicinamibacterales bacterium]
MSNRLADEHSPYLLQHKDNPVDWYPWGAEAFERASREDKPIFLSIGYSTCHWCHVMEHESFESRQVAEVLNRHFVPIKVDREERPDVDRVYMTFVQATTGSGGWPMSVWLTPSLQPFYGGTYFPPASKWGRPGFIDILKEIARAWEEDRARIETSAESITERLRELGRDSGGRPVPEPGVLDEGVRQFATAFDVRRGGFGDAPKFPRPSELLFLLREHARTGSSDARDMVLVTLRAMALGGMRDHVGGGFHRYSVDGSWRVPHFEKMLYDQAQLVLAYLEAAQASGDPFFTEVAEDTLAYVQRELTDEAGGFYSAEDADSIPPEDVDGHQEGRGGPSGPPHKMEGAFYIWRDEEIRELLGEDADVFRIRYGILPDGNAPFDPQNEFVHKNLLYTARGIDEVMSATAKSRAEVEAALARARAKLQERRSTRPRPHLDDKVLTAWNGLMIAAFARAARVVATAAVEADLKVRLYRDAARRAALFIWKRLWIPETRTLLRRYRKGDAAVEGYAEDYAYLIFGLLELFQADGDPRWLEWALMLQRRQDELFADPVEGGWFSTTGRDESVLLRLKEDYDGAEPSATSVTVLNLLTLSHLTGDAGFEQSVERAFGVFASRIEQGARTVPMMMAALSAHHAGMSQVVVTGDPAASATRALNEVVARRYLPFAITIPLVSEHAASLARLLPWTEAMARRVETSAAYVCRNFACLTPATSAEELIGQLR